jgi:hypothetical protein
MLTAVGAIAGFQQGCGMVGKMAVVTVYKRASL